MNLDGVPEWTIEIRPTKSDVAGRLILHDFISGQDLLTITGSAGQGVQIFGMVQPDGITAPAPIASMGDDKKFVAAFCDLFSDYSLDLFVRSATAPNAPGNLYAETNLTVANGFVLALADHDQDGVADIFGVFYEAGRSALFYGRSDPGNHGKLPDCKS